MSIEIPGFTCSPLSLDGERRDVYRRGQGRAVIVMSEVPGITPQVARFATRVADAGFSVWMPQLFGTPLEPVTPLTAARTIARVCISREFRLLAANQSSPIVDWLRALARHAHAECGGPGVGSVGMCLTGNFGLALMLDAPVIAPVLAQPSLPGGLSHAQRSGLHASPEEIAAAHDKIDKQGARILGLRFDGDPMCRAERFERLQGEFGAAFEAIVVPSNRANPQAMKPAHSVMTTHLIDREGEPTRAALDRTLAFLREQLNRD
ncbi:dienelactone hydrolase [Solimonas sp. K1W22B-7]|uniref:dienelactone hydrolase family protein n=1 Tax=Solimonas sp. K1W22B-7 TaxID=2303331 RepID=UPI000E330489|nr:dienelactone hydrolase family protein [Solimonas sp. K1W22B-7]AXQ28650.1 dienelactone hydrolase [Solimonas sp. K1W22B-7]